MRKFVAVTSLLAAGLVGCSQPVEFSRLTFDQSVREDRGQEWRESDKVLLDYRCPLIRLLMDHDIDPKKVSMRVDPEDDHSVILSAAEKVIDQPGMAGFTHDLKAIAEARLPLTLTFDLALPDDHESRTYTVNVKLGRVELSHAYGLGHAFSDALTRSRPVTEAHCAVAAEISPTIPIKYFDFRSDEAGKSHQLVVSLDDYKGEVDADLTFSHQGLQALIESGEIAVSMPVDSSARSDMFQGRLGQIDLKLGPLGKVEHSSGRVDRVRHSSLRLKCREMALSHGRPFTFFMDDSLDRLVSVAGRYSE